MNVPKKLTTEYVRLKFAESGCTLLSEDYVSAHEKMRYVCECGNTSLISWNKFKKGQRCSECRYRKCSEKMRGHNNPNWNHDMPDEDRVDNRDYPEYKRWRKAVFERDCHTCQSCGQVGGELNAHHINAYRNHEELRLDEGNGVTLCAVCHREYHSKYTLKHADEETFKLFLKGEHAEPWYAGEVM